MIWVWLIVAVMWLVGCVKEAELRGVGGGWGAAVCVFGWPVVDGVVLAHIWWTRWQGHREANR